MKPLQAKKSLLKDSLRAVAGFFCSKPPMGEGMISTLVTDRLKRTLHQANPDKVVSELSGSEGKIRIVGSLVSDAEYRFYAIWSLGMVAQSGVDISSAVPELTAALRNEDKNVRVQAVRALSSHWININDERNMMSILESGDRFMLRSAVEAFGESALAGNRNAISFMVKCLAHEDPALREMIFPILGCTAKSGKHGAKETLRGELDGQRFQSDITNLSAAKSRRALIKIMDDSESERKSS